MGPMLECDKARYALEVELDAKSLENLKEHSSTMVCGWRVNDFESDYSKNMNHQLTMH
jgi:hypothetical protein